MQRAERKMCSKQISNDISYLLPWIEQEAPLDSGIGLIPDTFRIELPNLKIEPVLDCDILVGLENGSLRSPSKVLNTFLQSRAKKLFLFCISWLTKAALTDVVLNARSNLLDRSILLPKGAVLSLASQFSLLVLDKTRTGERTIRFVDATDIDATLSDITDSLKKCPQVEKNCERVILDREPLLASYHCAIASLRNAIGGSYTTLTDCASLTKSPSYLRQEGTDPIELACLSPADYSSIGYTLPCKSERKLFPQNRIDDEQFLRGSDILLFTQSNVGKLCIVDPSFAEKNWTGTSFTWIVRPRSLDPRVLYIYLSSRKVQQYLSACSRGTPLPALPVPQLKNLPIPEFSHDEQSCMITAFNDLDSIRRSMADLTLRARMILRSFYF